MAVPGQSPRETVAENGATALRQVPQNDNWFTYETIDNLLGRWADQAVDRYELNAEQANKLRKMLRSRWFAFQHDERPGPLFDAVQREWLKTQQDMRAFLTPAQQVRLNADAIETAARLRSLGKTLETQSSPSGVRDSGQATHKTASSAAQRRVDQELLRWDHFVAEFIQRHQLDNAQRHATHSVLRECKTRALDHFNRNRVRIERLEAALGAGGIADDDQGGEIEAMYGPFDAIFAELNSRIKSIPTTAQTAAAAHE